MKKIIMTTLLLCTGFIIAGCEKTYSVEEFKKNEELFEEWAIKCISGEISKNCENMWEADKQLNKDSKRF